MPPPPPGASAPAPRSELGSSGSRGLRTASIVLFWCTAAAAVLVVAALFNRRAAWTDLADGEGTLVDALQFTDADDLGIVDTYVHYLRRKLARDVIRTVRGLGYQLGKS